MWHKSVPSFLVGAALLAACNEGGVNSVGNPVAASFERADSNNGGKLRKVTVGQAQYGLYHYDDQGKITKYEFFGLDGSTGQERRTIYADYAYQGNRLSFVKEHIFYKEEFVNSRNEKYEYDGQNRLLKLNYQLWSEITNRWSESTQEFVYNERDQLIQTILPGSQMIRYHYDENGNVWKVENYPLFEVEYEGPLTITFTFDSSKNPFYRHDIRPLLPLASGNAASMLNPNNVTGWASYSPITGDVIARSSIVYEYNAERYPTTALESVVSPLTDPQPNTEVLFTEYEYVQ